MTLTNVTVAEARAGLLQPGDARWAGLNITFSIPNAGAVWVTPYGTNEPTDAQYGTFDTTQAQNFRAVMGLWDAVIAPTISEVSDATPGQIRIAFTDVSARYGSGVGGFAYGPPIGGEVPVHGDIWIDESLKSSTFAPGTQDFQLLLHEAGHALGLKHPFESPTLPVGYDSKTYTVMSYASEDSFFTWSSGGGSIFYSVTGTVSVTPMVLDILALQSLYGADPNTGAGNTVYAFTDASLNGRRAIYDAGGTDTLDLSALTRGSTVDLRPGAYSDLAYYNVEDQIDDLVAQYGAQFETFIRNSMTGSNPPAYEWERNLGLSFSTMIENAIGSNRADDITGNTANNTLNGGGGADILRGLGGNDTYIVDNVGDVVDESVAGSGGIDMVRSTISISLVDTVHIKGAVESVTLLGGANLNALGNSLNNLLTGNAGANTLNGGGGADTMRGMAGNDTYTVDNAGDVVDESIAGSGGIDLVRSLLTLNLLNTAQVKGIIENVTLLGAANANVVGNGVANVIIGNSGNNQLAGGFGNDTLTGGAGNDAFLFNTAPNSASNVDRITDMNELGNDTIRLENAVFTALAAGALTTGAFRVGAAALDADDRIMHNRGTGELFYDADGSGVGTSVRFAIVDPGLILTAADFFVV